MADTIQFYTNPQSRGRIVRWMLEEIGEPYDTEIVPFGPQMKTAAYRSINPMGKVPAVIHGDQVVTECAAICAYLADAFPERGLAPPPARRASYYRWLFFAAGPLEAATTNASLNVEVPDAKRGMIGYGTLAKVIDTLEAALSASPYLAGDRFSAADVYVGSQLGWNLMSGLIEKRPAFADYHARLRARPAFVRADTLDNEAAAAMRG